MIWQWVVAAAVVAAVSWLAWRMLRRPDAYVYLPPGMAVSQFRYQDLPMKECAWCGCKLNLNRHHILPWAASPELKDEPTNLVVLCRDDHFRVAHGGNWKRFNANLAKTIESRKWVSSNDYYKETHGGNDRTEVRR